MSGRAWRAAAALVLWEAAIGMALLERGSPAVPVALVLLGVWALPPGRSARDNG